MRRVGARARVALAQNSSLAGRLTTVGSQPPLNIGFWKSAGVKTSPSNTELNTDKDNVTHPQNHSSHLPSNTGPVTGQLLVPPREATRCIEPLSIPRTRPQHHSHLQVFEGSTLILIMLDFYRSAEP